MMLDTPAMFERVVRMNATSDEQAARIVQNRFYRNMADALSGTQEFMASEALYELHADQRFDLVVVDTPPSRNALDFLEAPGVLARFLDHKVFRLIMLPTRTGFRMLSFASQPILRAIGRVVGSDALADAAAFFQAFAGMEGGFRERAEMVAVAAAGRHHPVRARHLGAPRDGRGGGLVRRPADRSRLRRGGGRRQPRPSPVRCDHGRRGAAARDARRARLTARRGGAVGQPRRTASPRRGRARRAGTAAGAGSGRIDDRDPAAADRRARPRRRSTTSPAISRSPEQDAVAAVRAYNVGAVHILLATDADWIVDEVTAALGGPDTSFTVCREGRLVPSSSANARPTSSCSTCRSVRWAGWRSRWRSGSTSRAVCSRTSRS